MYARYVTFVPLVCLLIFLYSLNCSLYTLNANIKATQEQKDKHTSGNNKYRTIA